MRLKEDDSSWRSGGIKRRMYRQAPLTPEQEIAKGHPKRKNKKTRKAKSAGCKHVWVEVKHPEYNRYRSKTGWSGWWYTNMRHYEAHWIEFEYTTYFVCAGCQETKIKIDRAKQRKVYRKRYGRSW